MAKNCIYLSPDSPWTTEKIATDHQLRVAALPPRHQVSQDMLHCQCTQMRTSTHVFLIFLWYRRCQPPIPSWTWQLPGLVYADAFQPKRHLINNHIILLHWVSSKVPRHDTAKLNRVYVNSCKWGQRIYLMFEAPAKRIWYATVLVHNYSVQSCNKKISIYLPVHRSGLLTGLFHQHPPKLSDIPVSANQQYILI